MHLSLQIYLIERYTKVGDTILDPMAGSGTVLAACALGRNVILCELESKFVDMQKANWEKIKAQGAMLGYKLGRAAILQGDARNLQGLLADKIDCICSSPPYQAEPTVSKKYLKIRSETGRDITKPSAQYRKYSEPYAEAQIGDKRKTHNLTIQGIGKDGKPKGGSLKAKFQADVILTSPPYEDKVAIQDLKFYKDKCKKTDRNPDSPHAKGISEYSKNTDNIGNLKSDNYLQAMAQVYRECFAVLRDKGLMVIVVKNFVRKGQVIQLDSDTIRLCESAGFTLQERLKRKLTQLSFWRTLEKKRWEKEGRKYPEDMMYEHILVFKKSSGV